MHNYTVMPKKGGRSGAYAGPCIGGTYHDQNGDDVVTGSIENGKEDGFNFLMGARAELYTFDENWSAIVENARGQQEAGIPLQYRFRHLFQTCLHVALSLLLIVHIHIITSESFRFFLRHGLVCRKHGFNSVFQFQTVYRLY